MGSTLRALALTCAVWVLIGSASARAEVTLLQDDRGIFNSGSGASATPATAFQDWNASVSQASQQSRVGTQQMSGSGGADAFSDLDNSEGLSRFDIGFQVTDPVRVILDGSFEMQDEAFGSLLAIASVDQSGQRVFGMTYFPLDEIQTFFFDELLGPGVYRLLISISPNGNASSSFDFTFDVMPVPEPGTAGLLGAGLALMALRRKRARADR